MGQTPTIGGSKHAKVAHQYHSTRNMISSTCRRERAVHQSNSKTSQKNNEFSFSVIVTGCWHEIQTVAKVADKVCNYDFAVPGCLAHLERSNSGCYKPSFLSICTRKSFMKSLQTYGTCTKLTQRSIGLQETKKEWKSLKDTDICPINSTKSTTSEPALPQTKVKNCDMIQVHWSFHGTIRLSAGGRDGTRARKPAEKLSVGDTSGTIRKNRDLQQKRDINFAETQS